MALDLVLVTFCLLKYDNWKYVELLHQCKGNVLNYLALCSCGFFVYFYMLINYPSSQRREKVPYVGLHVYHSI